MTNTTSSARIRSCRFTVGIDCLWTTHCPLMFPVSFGTNICFNHKVQKKKKKEPGMSMIVNNFTWWNCLNIYHWFFFSFFFFLTSNHNISAINYWHYLHVPTKAGGRCKTALGSKRPLCSINYASRACLITWSTRLANKPWPDLLIIKMQSNLLPVCCSDWTWRGAAEQPRCLLVTYLYKTSATLRWFGFGVTS